MIFTDTHAHVFLDEFEGDFENCFNRSTNAGVSRVFVPNIDEFSIEAVKNICLKYKQNYFPMMGLHPCSVSENWEKQLEKIYSEFSNSKYFGIGEVGIDLYWDKSTFEIQKKAFVRQAQWAIDLNLPVSIHSRNATDEIISIIKTEKLEKLKGVFHCFSGDISQAETIINMGFYLGIGGTVTYKNSTLPQVIAKTGIKNIVLETDSPYLPPVPHRGKRNETSYIPLIASRISEILEISIEKTAEITTNNSKNIFGI
ncbi:MAG: TatD family hydrolase [Bacteroidetes bacterium]|nr:TatD family hydrolase [Bacteroidota bacterium]